MRPAMPSVSTQHQNYLDKSSDGYCHLSPAIFELALKKTRK